MTDDTEQVGWFDALGNEIPRDQRINAAREARKMGLDVPNDSEWVDEVADLVEADRPESAIGRTREMLDLSGTFRFLAALCVPVSDQHEPVTELDDMPFAEWKHKADVNIGEWGRQSRETLLLCMMEELGELTQAHLESKHGDGDYHRISKELDDLAALCLQLHWEIYHQG